MKLVVIESPFASSDRASAEEHVKYARKCLANSLNRGEAPLASHLLYTQVLDDQNGYERDWGIRAGLAWNKYADLVAVYIDYGITPGMRRGIEFAVREGITIEERTVGVINY